MESTEEKKSPLISTCESKAQAQKKLVEELKTQWKLLWSKRFEDKVRAEGISIDEYIALSVEQGTVIHATKDFKALNFKEILEKHLVENPDRYVAPNVNVGGWGKFIKTEINPSNQRRNSLTSICGDKKARKRTGQQSKKGGRGWLHTT
jgi:hypothetical protein